MEITDIDLALRQAIAYDPVQAAEDLAGVLNPSISKTELDQTSLSLHLRNEEVKDGLLLLSADTNCYSKQKMKEVKRIITSLGFEAVYRNIFNSIDYPDYPEEEQLIYWRNGVMIHITTFGQNKMNTCSVYLNLRTNTEEQRRAVSQLRASGGATKLPTDERVYALDKDGRQGLRLFLKMAEEAGEILSNWVSPPHLYFFHHGDHYNHRREKLTWAQKDELHKQRKKEVLSQLPPHVQAAINIERILIDDN